MADRTTDLVSELRSDSVRPGDQDLARRAANEIQALRERIVSAEVTLAMFVAVKPRIDPRKMLQAYTMSYPEPMASERSVEVCVAAKEAGERAARGGRVS